MKFRMLFLTERRVIYANESDSCSIDHSSSGFIFLFVSDDPICLTYNLTCMCPLPPRSVPTHSCV